MAQAVFCYLSVVFSVSHAFTVLPFNFTNLPLADPLFINNAVKKMPNIFGFAKYLPKIGQEQIAEDMVKNLLETVLNRPETVMPDEINLPKMTVDIPNFGRMIIEEGKVKGLLAFTHDPLKISTEPDGKMAISIQVHFTNLWVIYNRLTVEPWGYKLKDYGKVSLKFNSNILIMEIAVVKYFEVFDRFIKKECICFLTSITITDLGDVGVVYYVNGAQSGSVQNRLLSKGIWYVKDAVSQRLNYSVIKYAYEKLVSEGHWLCKDERLHRFVQEVDEKEAEAKKLAEERKKASWGNSIRSYFI